MHTLPKYTIVHVDNLKNNFARESQTEPTVCLFAATVGLGLDQGSPKNPIERETRGLS
jgi:hypothetical protein